MRFFQLFILSSDLNHCVYEDTCKDGDSYAYSCAYVIVRPIKRQKKCALLSHWNRDGARIALLFVFQRLKIGCFKTAVLKTRVHTTDVVPRLGTSSSFCPGWSCSYSEPPASVSPSRPVVACKDRSHPNDEKYERKQCILRHHEINDRA